MDTQLKVLAETLRERYGKPLQQILFFGSRARGDFGPESDYDCLLVFKKVTPAVKEDLDHFSAEWLLERGIVFSWVAVSEADLERLRFEPFVRNARQEGITA